MIITLHSKGGGLIAEIQASDDSPVPRVGEFIDSPAHSEAAGRLAFLATEVRYLVANGRLQAIVTAHARGDDISNRLIVLVENGWLHPRG